MGSASPPALAFAIRSPMARADLPGLCARVCALLDAGGASRAVCDVAGARADAVTVDALARLQLAARRYGCTVELIRVSEELRELLELMGLSDVAPEPGAGR